MKNQPFLSTLCVLSIVTALAGSACKKSNNSTPANTSTATVSGKAFQSSAGAGLDITSTNSFTLLFSQVASGDSLIMELDFPDTITLNKAYALGGSQSAPALSYTNFTTQDWFSTGWSDPSGTITVTSLNKTAKNVQGTYSGIVWKAGGDSLIITNGKFNANYVQE